MTAKQTTAQLRDRLGTEQIAAAVDSSQAAIAEVARITHVFPANPDDWTPLDHALATCSLRQGQINSLREGLASEQEMSRDLLRANANEIDRLTEERDLLREFARQFAVHHDVRPGAELTRWNMPIDDLWSAWRNVQFTCLDPGVSPPPVDGSGM